MVFTKPTKRFEKKTGFSEAFHLDSERTTISINTNAGGYDKYDGVNEERHLYIIRGLGAAAIKGEDYVIQGGSSLTVPKGNPFSVEGQFKYALIQGNVDVEVVEQAIDQARSNKSKESTFVYVLEGVGNAVTDGKIQVLREGTFVEVPRDVNYSITGRLKYILVSER